MTNTSISSRPGGDPDLVQALPMRGYPDLVRALRAMLRSKFLVPICLFTVLTSTMITNSGPGYPDLVQALPMRGYPDLVRALRAMLMSKFRGPISLFIVLTSTMRRKTNPGYPDLVRALPMRGYPDLVRLATKSIFDLVCFFLAVSGTACSGELQIWSWASLALQLLSATGIVRKLLPGQLLFSL
jgi:hypothetical protein